MVTTMVCSGEVYRIKADACACGCGRWHAFVGAGCAPLAQLAVAYESPAEAEDAAAAVALRLAREARAGRPAA